MKSIHFEKPFPSSEKTKRGEARGNFGAFGKHVMNSSTSTGGVVAPPVHSFLRGPSPPRQPPCSQTPPPILLAHKPPPPRIVRPCSLSIYALYPKYCTPVETWGAARCRRWLSWTCRRRCCGRQTRPTPRRRAKTWRSEASCTCCTTSSSGTSLSPCA